MAARLTCPRCQSHDLWRAHRRPLDVPLTLLGLHPFRCRTCNHRFYRRDAEAADASRNGDSELKRILSELPPPADGVLDAAKPVTPELDAPEANVPEANVPEADVPEADAPGADVSEAGPPPTIGPVTSRNLLKDYSVKPPAGASKADPDDFPDDYPWDHKWSREE